MTEPHVSVYSDHVCTLGEGPSFDPVSDTLFWFDIVNRLMLSKTGTGGETKVVQLEEMASALAIVDDDRQLLLTETGLYLREARTGRTSLHIPIEDDRADTRSNDARVHPSGAFWVSTMGKAAETGAGSIYWCRGGEIRRLFGGLSIPNSICFSADGRTAHFTDTATNRLMRVGCDPETGLPAGEPRLMRDTSAEAGGLDGSVMDRDGVLWNARWGVGRLDAYAPDGALVKSVALPAKQPACPAFVGPDCDRIVVTTAAIGIEDDAAAGLAYLVDMPVKGLPEPRAAI